jgi:hypothetical protein
MLLTDGNPNNTEDLRAYESEILSVANTEMIDLSVKLGLATEEVAQEVLDFLVNRSSGADPQVAVRRDLGVGDVVVSRQMKRWHVLRALEMVHRDGFHNQLNDRYKAKFFEYKKLAAQARMQTFQFGVGLVRKPLPVAEAPVFGFVTGPLEATVYYARVAWVGADGQEGLASAVTTFDAPPGSLPVVEAVNAPVNAVAYHVYMGLSEAQVMRQTGAVVAIGDAFTLGAAGLEAGIAPGHGQVPDTYLTGARVLRRG